MEMTVSNMRKAITNVYPGEKWKKKVERMSDSQVMAIYYSFEKSGKFEE